MRPLFMLGGDSPHCYSTAASCDLLALAKDPLQAGVFFQGLHQIFVGKNELCHQRRDRSGNVGVSVPVAGCGQGEEGDGVDSIRFPDVRLCKGIGRWVGFPHRRGLRILPREVFLHKVGFKIYPGLSCRWPLISLATRVSEVACGKNQVVIRSHNLLWHLQDLYGVSEVHSRLNLFDAGLGRLVDIVRHIHVRCVELEVYRGDIVIVLLDVIDHLEAHWVSVFDVPLLERPYADVLHAH